ncbi:SAM-dependent methyltransferase [Candidatus Nitrosacidococcus tergens]|uniref:DUF7884 domain-containing protein n=1 Tax=Candidatus Nitrosacidococcus tergens TaxID=553981 RepID=A0A7G1Q7U1_9GAMM|nr:cyclopropane-fatty-acyl-phospholipid synthase family protein [Candidatus Nitrosacidococcus tergens]CAB1274756.1 conserved protein of unknown function [Candidatus Nitrosacidococcus tergens]
MVKEMEQTPPAMQETTDGASQWLTTKIKSLIKDIPVDVTLWDKRHILGGIQPATAHITIHSRIALLKILIDPELYVGEAYVNGKLTIKGDLVTLIKFWGSRDVNDRPGLGYQIRKLIFDIRANTLSRAKGYIYHHYDISNDFYKLWLDKNMSYTCAYFPEPNMELEAAQVAKMEHICRKLELKPGEKVVEAGCGWGALAIYMAKHYGVNVQAYNISKEQLAYAQEQAKIQNLSDKVQFIEDDYRNISSKFDAFVSVGMLEHVGKACYPEMGSVIHRSLTPEGRGLLHFIGRNYPRHINRWIRRHIFPGAYPPTLCEVISDIFEPWNFSVTDIENLRLHYAKTLEHWLVRFEKKTDRVKEIFDEQFVRAWRLYLAGSEASFLSSRLQLFQITFTRGTNNNLAWNRNHLYQMDGLNM